jgi:aminoglycoside phosphotransferase (APT) family kinase protein
MLSTKFEFSSPFTIKQFKLGQSNPTFLLIDSKDRKVVVRKKPPGFLMSKTAHAIDREYLVMSALKQHTNVPVPAMLHYCTDESILGTEFYVMEFLNGRIFADSLLPTIDQANTRQYYENIIQTLADLHTVDFKKIGLGSYGKSQGYYQRQLHSLYKLSEIQGAVAGADGQKVGSLVHIQASMRWMLANLPKDEASLIHGDFKTDNIVFHPTESKLIGILDWELLVYF